MLAGIVLFLKIMLINLVLSGDNAVVIALASKNLPPPQRKKAVLWGASGAVILRIVLTVAAVFLLMIPYIQAIGSLFLLYISVKLLTDNEEGHSGVKEASSLVQAVWFIMAADFIMSLDNVLAIAAIAEGNYILMACGVAVSIPLIVWGSTLIMKLLQKYWVLTYVGAGVLGYTAGEMAVKDESVARIFGDSAALLHWLVPIVYTLFVVGFGTVKNMIGQKNGTPENKKENLLFEYDGGETNSKKARKVTNGAE